MPPPGPRLPVPLQTLGWITRPGPWMERCRDRYGDAFTLRIANEGTWVLFSDPAAVKQIFTGDPKLLHAGEANGILRPILGPNSVLLLDERAHIAQRKLLLTTVPRRADEGAVVKETLRLRPVLPIVLRKLKSPMEIGGFALPEGVAAVPCIYLMHRREDIYPEPRAFRPERFLGAPAGTYTWIPFGGGVRRCLGAAFAQFEMAAVLRVLARRCERLEPDALVPERIARRSITLVPEREGRVLVG